LGTKDVDLAVLISDKDKYMELKNFLVQKEAFTASTSNEYIVFDKKGNQIDLLPFGAIEIEGKKIIDKEGLVHTDLSGFKEVYETTVEEVNFPVCQIC
jgi:predicted nucleotidyltransferase